MKADELKGYIAWAVENGFGIVDVNIPTFLTGISVREDSEESTSYAHKPLG